MHVLIDLDVRDVVPYVSCSRSESPSGGDQQRISVDFGGDAAPDRDK